MTTSWRDEPVAGRYELEWRIGNGAFGEVWKAVDLHFDDPVAVKILVPPRGEDTIPVDDRRRFDREAKLTKKFRGRHHIVLVTDVGEHHGHPFLVMPLLQGDDLQELLDREGRLAPERAVQIVGQIGEALTATHAVGLVHRDVKPANVFVEETGEATLLDFGMVGALPAGALSEITRRGEFTGTAMYMAPERLPDEHGREATAPSSPAGDLYALACLLHECLTGTAPFRGNDFELWCRHRAPERPCPGKEDADLREFDAVVTRGLACQFEDRQDDVAAFVAEAEEALEAWRARTSATVEGPEPEQPRRPVAQALVGGAGVGALGVGAVAFAATPPEVGVVAVAASWAAGACLGWWYGSRPD